MNWHQLDAEEVCSRLGSSPAGLAPEEAARRLAEHGPNELQATHRTSPWTLLLAQFKNLLIVILLIATLLSGLLGHQLEALAIAVIVFFAVGLGFLQEWRAERAIEALGRMAAPTATVRRAGGETEIPARDLVPGDIILLRTGAKVPADARLLEAVNLQLEEAALTGESAPVAKETAPLTDAQLPVGDRRNMIFAGTAATYGRGRGVVVATGMETEFGRIARMLETVETGRTPLQENLDRVGRLLAWAALAVVAVIVVLGLLRGQPFVEMLLFGVALAVAVVPEALPAVVTVSLAIGVQRLARRNALMRRLAAVETLGSTSIICSDKTGTLTRDEMTVRRVYADGETIEVGGSGYEPSGRFTRDGEPVEVGEPLRRLLRAAVLASDAQLRQAEAGGRWEIRGDPTEGALLVAAAKIGLEKAELDEAFPRVDEIPFTAEAKRMTTLHQSKEGVFACSKGAVEVILAACRRQLTAEGEREIDDAGRAAILEVADGMAQAALRVLAVAFKAATGRQEAEAEMTFLGLVGMFDPPRAEAADAVSRPADRPALP